MITKTATLIKLAYSDEIKKLMREDPRVRKILAENQISGNLDSFIKKLSELGYKPEKYGFANRGGRWEVSGGSPGYKGGTTNTGSARSSNANAWDDAYQQYRKRQDDFTNVYSKNRRKRTIRNANMANRGYGIWLASALAAPVVGSLYKRKEYQDRFKDLGQDAKKDVKTDFKKSNPFYYGKPSEKELAAHVGGPAHLTSALSAGATSLASLYAINDTHNKLFREPSNKANIRKFLKLRTLPLLAFPAAIGGAHLGSKLVDKKFQKLENQVPSQQFAKAASDYQLNKEELHKLISQKREKEKLKTNDNLQNSGVAGSIVAGAGLVNKELKHGNLTGRETLYHGTNPSNKASILATGLKPTTEANAVNTAMIKDVFPGVYKDSLGKTFLSRKKFEAWKYSIGAQVRNDPSSPPKISGGVIKANVPIWKMKTVRNPESAMGYEAWAKSQDELLRGHGINKINPVQEFLRRRVYNEYDRAVVLDGGLDSKFLRGANDYKGLTFSELKEFLSKNKGRALKGYGKAGLGVGTAALGTKYFMDRATKDKQSN